MPIYVNATVCSQTILQMALGNTHCYAVNQRTQFPWQLKLAYTSLNFPLKTHSMNKLVPQSHTLKPIEVDYLPNMSYWVNIKSTHCVVFLYVLTTVLSLESSEASVMGSPLSGGLSWENTGASSNSRDDGLVPSETRSSMHEW